MCSDILCMGKPVEDQFLSCDCCYGYDGCIISLNTGGLVALVGPSGWGERPQLSAMLDI